jgi:hypothetical protein
LQAVRDSCGLLFDAPANDFLADHVRAAIDESGIDDRAITAGYRKIENKKLGENNGQ